MAATGKNTFGAARFDKSHQPERAGVADISACFELKSDGRQLATCRSCLRASSQTTASKRGFRVDTDGTKTQRAGKQPRSPCVQAIVGDRVALRIKDRRSATRHPLPGPAHGLRSPISITASKPNGIPASPHTRGVDSDHHFGTTTQAPVPGIAASSRLTGKDPSVRTGSRRDRRQATLLSSSCAGYHQQNHKRAEPLPLRRLPREPKPRQTLAAGTRPSTAAAENPPCAYQALATCPAASAAEQAGGSRLPVGEQRYRMMKWTLRYRVF